MQIKRDKAKDFYKGLVNLAIKAEYRAPPEHYPDAVFSFLGRQESVHQLLAVAALDLGFGPEKARGHLAESARFSIELLARTELTSALEALQTLYRIGTCHDRGAAKRFSKGYARTPEGKRGEMSTEEA